MREAFIRVHLGRYVHHGGADTSVVNGQLPLVYEVP